LRKKHKKSFRQDIQDIKKPEKNQSLPANPCGGLARQSLWWACPPILVVGLPANPCGGLARQSLWWACPPISVAGQKQDIPHTLNEM